MKPISIIQFTTLLAAGASMVMSVYVFFAADDKLNGIFVGTWVPSILALGAFLVVCQNKKNLYESHGPV